MNANKRELIESRLPQLEEHIRACRLCGRACAVDRVLNAQGFCQTSGAGYHHVRYAAHTLHFGEEPMLVGKGGSGTVFFGRCNLRCVFCQNYQISHLGIGREIHYGELARIFLELQERGAENINLVTPTHYIYPILLALKEAYSGGLDRPLVYNTNGYESLELLRFLEGIMDVYLPDMKYMDPVAAEKFSGAPNYPEVAKKAIKEMYRQVGPLQISDGVARKGLIIRHLVLPHNLAGSYDFLLWLKDEGLAEATLSLMSQYSPQHRAAEFDELRAPVPPDEYARIVEYALDLGFPHVLVQHPDSTKDYLPNFTEEKPFARP